MCDHSEYDIHRNLGTNLQVPEYLLYPTHKGIGLSKFDNHNLVSPPHTTALGMVHKTLSDGAGTGTSAQSSPLRQATAHQDASFTSE